MAMFTKKEKFKIFLRIMVVLAFILLPAVHVFAQASPAVQTSLDISILWKGDIDPDQFCAVLNGQFGCSWVIDVYVKWSRSRAYPLDDPSSPIGYWSGGLRLVSPFLPPSGQFIGGGGSYDGRAHVVFRAAGFATPEGFQAEIDNAKNMDVYVFTGFIHPDGTTEIVNSNLATFDGYDQTLALVSSEPELDLSEKFNKTVNYASCAGDPVYLHSGEFFYGCNDISVPGRKTDVEISHSYSSGLIFNGQFGYGWMMNYYMRLHKLRDGNIVIVGGKGTKTIYTLNGGFYDSPPGNFESLEKNPDNTFILTLAQGEQYQFDTDGKLSAIEDRNGNIIILVYDMGKQPHFGRHQYGQNPLNSIILGMEYRLIQIVDTNGRTILLNYNAEGLLASITNDIRNVGFTYDLSTNDFLTLTKPATAQFPSGVTKTFTYTDHDVTSITDAKGQTFVTNRYDSEGRVFEQDLGAGTLQFDYSVPGRTTVTDRRLFVTTHIYDANGNVISKEEFTNGLRLGEPASFMTNYTYNADMMRESITLPDGNGTKFIYDETNPDFRSRGNLLQVRRKTDMAVADDDLVDILTNITYESLFNQVKEVTDPMGRVTTYTYDYELDVADSKYATVGDLIFVDSPAVGEAIPGTPTVEYSYNAFGQVTEVIDPNGNVTQYAYEPATGYLQQIAQDPTGINALTQFTYDSFGNLDVVTDANGNATNYDYDELGWLTRITNPLGFVTNHFHDENGNVIRSEQQADDPVTTWQITQFTHDILNNLKTVTDPLSRVTTYNYDNNENLASVVDAELNTTSYVYDERNLLFIVTDANTPAGVTTYDYDLNGQLAKITDANGNPTDYSYDGFDRLDQTTYADSSFSDFDYDKNSNLVKHTIPGGAVIDYVFDELDRQTAKNFPANATLNSSYVYDLGSRLVNADNTASQINFTYDSLNRVLSETQILGSLSPLTLTSNYDPTGNRAQLVYPSAKTLDYTYDNNDRLDIIKESGIDLADYNYDPLNRRTQKSLITDLLPLTTYNYDIANQLSSVINTLNDSTAISQYAYPTYDAVGNRTQQDRTLQTDPLEATNYTYNDIYELTNVTGTQTNSYDYDNVGNRELVDGVEVYTPNTLNQYSNVDGTNYLYDTPGNLVFDGANNYTYDEENRLQDFNIGITNASYKYDALSRRVSKTVDLTTTYFVYDGDEVIAEYDSIGSLDAEYVTGNSIDEVLTMERAGVTYYYHYDGLGSVTELTDASGALIENYTYDSYGVILSGSEGSSGNPYYFTGRRFDLESNVYYYRARQYDPTIGRFLQRDPIGLRGGINLYAYVSNNPLNFIDPFGLKFAQQMGGQLLVTEDDGRKHVQETYDPDTNAAFKIYQQVNEAMLRATSYTPILGANKLTSTLVGTTINFLFDLTINVKSVESSVLTTSIQPDPLKDVTVENTKDYCSE